MHTRHYFIVLLLIILFWSCRKDNDLSWGTEWHGPLAKGNINISDLIADSLTYSGNQKVWLSLSPTLFEISSDSLVNIPEKIGQTSFHLPVSYPLHPGQKFLDLEKTHIIHAGPAQLKEVILEYGKIYVQTKSTYDEPVEYTYEFPGILRHGQPLKIKQVIAAAGSGTRITEKTFDIDGHQIMLTGKNNDSYNRIHYNVSARSMPDADSMIITPQDSLVMNIRFKELKIYSMNGYFGQKQLSLKDTTAVNIFENIHSGLIDLDSVDAAMHIENGVGVDLGLRINNLISINRYNQNQIPFQSGIINNNIQISRAIKQGNIQPIMHTLDLSDSNIKTFLENLPNHIEYDMDIQINPLGNISMGNDFYNREHPLKIDLDLNIPFNLRMQALRLTEDITLNIEEQSPVEAGELLFMFINSFPMEVQTDIYTGPPDNLKRHKLTGETQHILAGATTNAQGIVTDPAHSTIRLDIPETAMNDLKQSGRIRIEMKLQTTGMEKVQIYDHYHINYKITGTLNMKING
ncbi:MAG: hypothetical protein R6U19_01595 [Bacteroidales bacterium]